MPEYDSAIPGGETQGHKTDRVWLYDARLVAFGELEAMMLLEHASECQVGRLFANSRQ